MPGKAATDGSGSKWTRMWVDQDLANMNIRREQLAHIVHYKHIVWVMKQLAKELGRPLSILDVGSGESNAMRLFYSADSTKKSLVVKRYVGLEGDPSCVTRTEKKAATVLRGLNGSLIVQDITKDTWDEVEAGKFDLVFSNEVLEHIPESKVPGVLRNMRRAVRKKGLVVISTPNKDGTNDRLPADHVYEWGYDEIHEAFEAAGFEEVSELGVYIKKSKLIQYLRENDPDTVEWAEDIWERFGLDLGSIMTADLARPVANNVIHILKKV